MDNSHHFRLSMRAKILEAARRKPERISPALAAAIEQASWTAIEHLREQDRQEAIADNKWR